MKSNLAVLNYLIIFVTCGFQISCTGERDIKSYSFPPSYSRWTKPFEVTDTCIYSSDIKQHDTIIFYKKASSFSRTNNIGQGYSKTFSSSVDYELTKGSYHQFTNKYLNTDAKSFVSISKSFDLIDSTNDTQTNIEIYFLGLLYNNNFIDTVNMKKTQINFDFDNAVYKNLNINEGIRSFNFDFSKGIISFIDLNNHKWSRN